MPFFVVNCKQFTMMFCCAKCGMYNEKTVVKLIVKNNGKMESVDYSRQKREHIVDYTRQN